MIIYLETREVFLEHVRRNRIEEEVGERLKAIAGRRVSPSKVRAWRNSFQYVSQFLLDPKIPAALGVAIEYQIPNTSRRIDLLLSGRSPDDSHLDQRSLSQLFHYLIVSVHKRPTNI